MDQIDRRPRSPHRGLKAEHPHGDPRPVSVTQAQSQPKQQVEPKPQNFEAALKSVFDLRYKEVMAMLRQGVIDEKTEPRLLSEVPGIVEDTVTFLRDKITRVSNSVESTTPSSLNKGEGEIE